MRILLLESLHPDAEALLESEAEVLRAPIPSSPDNAALAKGVDAVITRGRGTIDAAMLSANPDLKCAARAGSGLDNLDVQAAVERGINIIYAPDAVTETTAEHAIALMLAAGRRIPSWTARVKNGEWDSRQTDPPAFDLAGRTIGIVGLGRIGARVAEIASALNMHVLYSTRSSVDARFERVSFEELLRRSDVVSIHVNLNDSTRGMMNAAALDAMKEGAVLVNCARGAVLDESALIQALKTGKLRAFAADVMAEEPPPPDHPLFAFEQVVLTPHSAALVEGAYRRLCVETAENVLRVLNGEPPDPRNVWTGS